MRKIRITGKLFLSNIYVSWEIYQTFYDDDKAHNHFQIPLTYMFLNSMKNSERDKVKDPTFDWLYWVFHID
jgi:hypothetical protein